MHITFMIGNGFDLNCGLKTSFRDVYAEYCKTASENEAICLFKQEINGKLDTWADFEMAMNDYMSEFKSQDEFLSCLWDFQRFMMDYLSEVERSFGSYSKDKHCVEDCINEFRRSVSSFYEGTNNNIKRYFQSAGAMGGITYSFVNFNYTTILDEFAKYSCTGNIIHVHGTLDDAPILGIDNESQLNSKVEFNVTKNIKRAFIKPVFNSEYDNSRANGARAAIKNSDAVCVFGLSLGDSDLSWRKLLIDWLLNDSKHSLIYYDYMYAKLQPRTESEKMNIADNAKSSLLLRWGVGDDNDVYEKLISQIHMPIGRNIFNINEQLLISLKSRTLSLGKAETVEAGRKED